jgi:hypothetical protein
VILGDTTFVNCTFSGNSAVDPGIVEGGYGGALVVAFANVTLRGSVFAHNTATSDAGGIHVGSGGHVLVENSILWGNTAGPDAPPIHAQIHGNNDIRYSCVEALLEPIPGEDPPDPENYPGSIDADPRLVDAEGPDGLAGTLDDDLRLAPDSPCVDAGENAGHPADSFTDLAGRVRYFDVVAVADTGLGSPPLIDMGAHERGASEDRLEVARLDAQGSELWLSWGVATCPGAASYHVVYGTGSQLPAAYDQTYGLAGAHCDVAPAPPHVWQEVPDAALDPTRLLWFLLVPDNGLAVEGSWGRNSGGLERYGPMPGGESGLCGMTGKDARTVCPTPP